MSQSFVQGTQNSGASATMPGNVAAGDLLVVWGRFFNQSSGATISDTDLNTWHLAGTFVNSTSGIYMWYCLAANAGVSPDVITIGGAVGSFPEFTVGQYNTTVGSWFFGSLLHAIGSQTSPIVTPTITAVTDDLIIGGFENETSNGTFTASSPWNLRNISTGNVAMVDQFNVASGAQTPTVQFSPSTINVGAAVARFTNTAPPPPAATEQLILPGLLC